VIDSSDFVVDSATTSVSGFNAAGVQTFKIIHATDQTFYVTLAVTDSEDNSERFTRTVTE